MSTRISISRLAGFLRTMGSGMDQSAGVISTLCHMLSAAAGSVSSIMSRCKVGCRAAGRAIPFMAQPVRAVLAGTMLAGAMAAFPAHAIILLSGNNADHNALENVKLEVVVETNNAPFAFLQHAMGRPVGFDVDVVYELQRRLGFELKENRFFPVDTETGFSMLKKYHADLLIGGIVKNDERMDEAEHTKVIYSSGFSIMVQKDQKNITSASSLKGARVGVKPNSPAAMYVSKVLGGEPVEFTNSIRGFYQLTRGTIDAFVAERSSLLYFANGVPAFNLRVNDDIFDFHDGQFVFYMQKGSPYLDIFNRTIASMESDGTMYRLREKWLAR